MQSRLLVILGAMVIAATACAKGTALVGVGGSDSSGSGGSSSGEGGGGAAGTTSGSGGATTATTGSGGGATTTTSTTGTTGTGGAPCPGDPCDTVLQCGCAQGEECGIQSFAVACVPEGNIGNGQQCGMQGSDCGPGLVCVQTAKAVSTCVKFCDKDNECQAPGGLCLLTLNDGMNGAIPGVTLCTENCNPSNNVGCPVPGTSCQLLQENMGQMRFLTRCGNAGVGMQNASCMSTDDCAITFGCFNTDPNDPNINACFKWCKIGSPPNCPGGTSCQSLQTPVLVGNDEYGVCF